MNALQLIWVMKTLLLDMLEGDPSGAWKAQYRDAVDQARKLLSEHPGFVKPKWNQESRTYAVPEGDDVVYILTGYDMKNSGNYCSPTVYATAYSARTAAEKLYWHPDMRWDERGMMSYGGPRVRWMLWQTAVGRSEEA